MSLDMRRASLRQEEAAGGDALLFDPDEDEQDDDRATRLDETRGRAGRAGPDAGVVDLQGDGLDLQGADASLNRTLVTEARRILNAAQIREVRALFSELDTDGSGEARSFVRSFVRPFVRSFVRSSVRSFVVERIK